MTKSILAALALTVAVGPLAATAADAQRTTTRVTERRNGTVVTRTTTQPGYHRWARGQHFDRRYAQNYQEIDYRRYRGLRAPPRGYRYVRSGNDAVLVGITSGIIASVITGAIR